MAGNVSFSLKHSKGSAILIDARHRFAFSAISLALSEEKEICKNFGIAATTVSGSRHFGQTHSHLEKLAEDGLIGLILGNTPKAISPLGGSKPLFGTNPVAFSSPRETAASLVIEMSLSKVIRGTVMVANQLNEKTKRGGQLLKMAGQHRMLKEPLRERYCQLEMPSEVSLHLW